MLTTLRIKNLALVTDVTVDFEPGLNVITGETGAGKSLLLGALNLLLGQRADRDLIRSGADQCAVEALFDARHLPRAVDAFLEASGLEPCQDDQLVLKRVFTSSGTNRQFVNGSPTSLANLASLGEWLVDMHGPHDHQSLLHPSRQRALLDDYGKLAPALDAFQTAFRQRTSLIEARQSLLLDESTLAQQLDLLRFQVREIEKAKLDPGEAAVLQADYQRAANAAKLIHLAQSAQNLLQGDDPCLLDLAGRLGRALQELERLDPSIASQTQLQANLTQSLQELQTQLGQYLDRLELHPEQLQALEERLNLVQSLQRKYGASIEEVLRFGQEARRRLEALEGREAELERIQAAWAQNERLLVAAGLELSAQRRNLIPKLTRAVMRQLKDLGFHQSQFDVALDTLNSPPEDLERVSPFGLDTLEFLFAPNPGEPARPLRAIASSGEMARVMLALKTVLADQDQVPVLVFDEVDANIGGETARAVGEKMRQIAQRRQVFCVTHLAPVAALAHAHWAVSKTVEAGRTTTGIRKLADKDRVAELGRMLGGPADASWKLAQTLLREASR